MTLCVGIVVKNKHFVGTEYEEVRMLRGEGVKLVKGLKSYEPPVIK